MPETIWFNGSNPTSPHMSNYRSVLDQVDSDVAMMLGSSGSKPESRRFSFNESGEIESSLFDFKNSLAQVSYAASTGGPHGPTSLAKPQPFHLGTASISGGIANRHPPQDSFLHKFSSVADATRDIELSNSLGTLQLDGSGGSVARRTSFNSEQGVKPFNNSPHGSVNENLNIRNARHQSISEKIDNYNNNSPIQASAALSVNSDLMSNPGQESSHNHQNFWNPAAATVFTPSQPFNQFLDGAIAPPPTTGHLPPNPYGRAPSMMTLFSPPPFVMESPPYMDMSMYGMMGYSGPPPPDGDLKFEGDAGSSQKKDPTNGSQLPTKSAGLPRVGLMNRQMYSAAPGFGFQPFNPYSMYTPSPPPSASPSNDAKTQSGKDVNKLVHEAEVSDQASRPHSASASTPPAMHGKRIKSGRGNNGANGKSGHHIYRSPLLEEVRSNVKGKEYFLKDIYGHIVEFTKDQHGSRFIQQKLPTASEEEKEVAFNEIRDISYELMTDVFGNYVIQKFFEHGSDTQRQVLLEYMTGNIYELSLQMYGCRVVQRALESISLREQIAIVGELKEYVLICAKDQNGNHVIQKSIERIPFLNIRFILDSLCNHIYHLSTHPYGCRVIQRLLEFSEIEDQKNILTELKKYIFYLVQDQYGNYVIQHILEHGNLEDKEEILKVALGSIVNFSKHKFASNVIEKCIKHGSLEQRKRILHEVMLGNEPLDKETVDDDSPLALMMKDQYANYVIQKLVEGFDPKSPEKKHLVVKLRQYLKQLSLKNNYGKHLASVEKMIVVAETALVEADRI